MSVLIDDLLRFSRVTTRALPPEKVDLSRVAREVISDLDTAVEEARAVIHVGDLPTVIADPLQMRQLLQNLIANAVKFHRPGVSPDVRVERVQPDDPSYVGFSVSDNGIGFEPEYGERIFRVFERLHSRDVYAGTGIGLALCRKIAERHGGTIVAESATDEGSRFTVLLPAAGIAFGPQTGGDAYEREPVHV
jgi:light-regulated signal transduction histidine kinase (bacteriophytochrome)